MVVLVLSLENQETYEYFDGHHKRWYILSIL